MTALLLSLALVPADLASRAEPAQLTRLEQSVADFDQRWEAFQARRAEVHAALMERPESAAAQIGPVPPRRRTLEVADAELEAVQAVAAALDPSMTPQAAVELARAIAGRRQRVLDRGTELQIWLAEAMPIEMHALGAPGSIFWKRHVALSEGPAAALKHVESVSARLRGWALVQVVPEEIAAGRLRGHSLWQEPIVAQLSEAAPAWAGDDAEPVWILGKIERPLPEMKLSDARVEDLRFLQLPTLLQALGKVGR
jgi:hypothetical protein